MMQEKKYIPVPDAVFKIHMQIADELRRKGAPDSLIKLVIISWITCDDLGINFYWTSTQLKELFEGTGNEN